MKTVLLISLLLCGLAAVADAQTLTLDGSCTLAWDAEDPSYAVTAYTMWINKDGTQMPTITIPPTATSLTCKDAGIQANGAWAVQMTATNSVGTSDGSNIFSFIQQLPATTKPMPPGHLRKQ